MINKPVEGAAGRLGPDRQEAFEIESIRQITAYIKDKAKDQKPFFIYWATYTRQLQGSKAHHNDKYVDKVNAQASEMAAHSFGDRRRVPPEPVNRRSRRH